MYLLQTFFACELVSVFVRKSEDFHFVSTQFDLLKKFQFDGIRFSIFARILK